MYLLTKAIVGPRAIAVALIFVMLAAGLPSFSGILIRGNTPAFTMDICHPLPSVDNSSIALLPAILPSRESVTVLPEATLVPESTVKIRSALAQPPDPPPPKALA
jgi:hypothetical protein